MNIEYHGWIVLATSQDDWSDDDFENSYERVAQAIQSLSPEEGHEPILPECGILPRVLYLKGSQVASLDPVFHAIEQVGVLFDRAYGELVVFEEDDLDRRSHPLGATRHFLINGKLIHDGPKEQQPS